MFIGKVSLFIMIVALVCFVLLIHVPKGDASEQLKVGAIFDADKPYLQHAFNHGINSLPSGSLTGSSILVRRLNVLEVTNNVCGLLFEGIVGIFGPADPKISPYVQSLCDKKEIPHIEFHWDNAQDHANCMINVHPHPSSLSKAYVDLVKVLDWFQFTVIYEDEKSLARVEALLSLYDRNDYVVTLRQLELVGDSYRPMLARMKKSGETHFVVDCGIETLELFLEQAQQVGVFAEERNFIFTNLDLQTLNLEPYQYTGANITGLRMVNVSDPNVQQVERQIAEWMNDDDYRLRLDAALLIDSIQLFYETIKSFNLSPKNLDCDVADSWQRGCTITNDMRTKSIRGLTGKILFDGFRKDFALEALELTAGGLLPIGMWNISDGYTIHRRYSLYDFDMSILPEEDDLRHTHFTVIICLTKPYAMLKDTTSSLTGNDRFEGFCIDLIQELSKMLGFNYTFIVQKDGNNGNFHRKTQTWDGMIGEVIRGTADLAITDLTITSERETATDFTSPFMNLGISILYKKPEPEPPSLFMFSSPFSLGVWLSLGIAYFVVSICLFVMGRLSPSEWTNPYPCIDEPEYLINQFSIRNSLWFTIGSLMQQGTEIAPIGISTRMAAGVWWFFTLIMVSSYTANLAAFLTVETPVAPFHDIEELADQKGIQYGAKRGGATANFFRDSNISTYKKIWEYMEEHPEVMTNTNEEGVDRVEKDNYAFLMESTSIEYMVERRCSLAQVGGLLDDKGYGIAMRKEAPYRNALSQAVVKLQESGVIAALKIKWWKEDRGGGSCVDDNSGGQPDALNLQNVGGVFLVLAVGTVIGFLCTFLQLCYNVFMLSYKENLSFREEFRKEIKFLFKFKQMVKPVRNRSFVMLQEK